MATALHNVPSDWPEPGPIDLQRHDLPHASSTLEWWYVNSHCVTTTGRRFSLFAAFFRQRDPAHEDEGYAHSVTWGLKDLDRKQSHHVSRVDKSGPQKGLRRIREGIGAKDPRINRAMTEVLSRGSIPLPDRMFDAEVSVATDRLALQYGNARFTKEAEGRYRLTLSDTHVPIAADVVIEPLKPPVRHGDDGVVFGPDSEAMFYVFVPRNRMSGTITLDGETHQIAEGQAWYDHEFGVGESEPPIDIEAEAKLPEQERAKIHKARRKAWEDRQIAWDWLSAQFDDGTEVSLYSEMFFHANQHAGDWAIVIDAEGNSQMFKGVTFEQTELWRSVKTFSIYPVAYRVRVPAAGIDLEVKAAFEDQEFITLLSKPSFWEGRVDVSGTVQGRAVRGVGFIEREGFATYDDLETFFDEVGKVVRESVERVIPLHPTYEQAAQLITAKGREHYMNGVDIEQYARTHIKPIREIVDRGGKGWRSYAAVACMDLVGGDSRNFIEWIALPEMMHVGSLIVDDVQDRSETRRGGKTVHHIYGEAHAINSGTAAYFIGSHLVRRDFLSDEELVRMYRLYFDALRAGHAGQAIDLDGFAPMMPEVIESGDSSLLEQRVLAIHRLKTAAPAGCLARIGGICGHASEEVIDAVGLFFEDLGLAFQIIDDVLNLRGFKGELKEKAEDIAQGKVTLPVAKAMSRLSKPDRAWLYATLQTKPTDPEVIAKVLEMLEGCGAIESCVADAKQLVEEGWQRLSPLVDDSITKVMLRGFGWYVLERHY